MHEPGVRVSRLGVVASLALVVTTFGLSGCAWWCPPPKPAEKVHATLPGQRPPDIQPDTIHGRPGVVPDSTATHHGFSPDDCACTLEYRMNLCVTVNGSESLPPDLGFVREREAGVSDTLQTVYGARCFGEWSGVQRILMLQDAAVVDSTGWFEIQTVDCCHGEAKTVDFRR